MILYPAIDIMEGSAVRLVQGDFAAATRYDADPLQAARRWLGEGAEWLHVVDLDGARAGEPVNLEHVRRIAAETGAQVQLGGGLRSAQAVADALAAGARRVVIGTAAVSDPQLLERLLTEHGAQRIAVALDARSGQVVTEGWEQRSGHEVPQLIEQLWVAGARDFIYTDVDRDGMLGGVNADGLRAALQAVGEGTLICSGGVGSLADLEALAAMNENSLAGVIVGKALYEQRFNVAEALTALS